MGNDGKNDESKQPRKESVPWKDERLPATERVDDWLRQEGTPLEFETAVEFSKTGFKVLQGVHEQQPEGDPLEVDVLAHERARGAKAETGTGHDVVVECKVAPRPWVAFLPLPWQRHVAVPIETGVLEAARFEMERRGEPEPELWPESPVAFGMTALHKGKDDRDHARLALNGVVARARLRGERFEASSRHATQLPVIVVDGELCLTAWDESTGTLRTKQVEACIVDYRGDAVLPTTQVQVVSRTALPRWLPEFFSHLSRRSAALAAAVHDVENRVRLEKLGTFNLDPSDEDERRLRDRLAAIIQRRRGAK